MFDGILNVYKEKGYTSHDVVAKLRGILGQRKIGHTGTLDPDAEGVLPVCLGKATRLCDMLTDNTKAYRAVLLLGLETDTQDVWGRVVSERTPEVTEEEVREAVMGFVGDYAQIPPMYSALKVNGKKLYELARAGKTVERQPRPVTIYEIVIESVELPRVAMTVRCSKGTYIRTLCHDIGLRLGCGGCMESLLRVQAGRFLLADSLKLGEIEHLASQGALKERIISIEKMFEQYPGAATIPQADALVRNGNPLKIRDMSAGGEWTGRYYRVYDSGGTFMGIYEWKPEKNCLMPWKMFLGGSAR